MDIFLQQIINGLVLGSMYALVALGYTMVYGIVNLINFAHGEVLMVGALTSWSVTVWLGPLGMPGWLLLLLQTLAMIIWKPNSTSYPTLLPRDPIFVGGAVTNFTQITIIVVTAITL